jgi:hypothetical protein
MINTIINFQLKESVLRLNHNLNKNPNTKNNN